MNENTRQARQEQEPIRCITCNHPLPNGTEEHPYYFGRTSIGWEHGREIDWMAEEIWTVTQYMQNTAEVVRSLFHLVELANKRNDDEQFALGIMEAGKYLEDIKHLSRLLSDLQEDAEHKIQLLGKWTDYELKKCERREEEAAAARKQVAS